MYGGRNRLAAKGRDFHLPHFFRVFCLSWPGGPNPLLTGIMSNSRCKNLGRRARRAILPRPPATEPSSPRSSSASHVEVSYPNRQRAVQTSWAFGPPPCKIMLQTILLLVYGGGRAVVGLLGLCRTPCRRGLRYPCCLPPTPIPPAPTSCPWVRNAAELTPLRPALVLPFLGWRRSLNLGRDILALGLWRMSSTVPGNVLQSCCYSDVSANFS
jgi:hypothetical protein